MPNNKYIINESQLVDIADAIRTKLNEQNTYTVDEMPSKIESIESNSPIVYIPEQTIVAAMFDNIPVPVAEISDISIDLNSPPTELNVTVDGESVVLNYMEMDSMVGYHNPRVAFSIMYEPTSGKWFYSGEEVEENDTYTISATNVIRNGNLPLCTINLISPTVSMDFTVQGSYGSLILNEEFTGIVTEGVITHVEKNVPTPIEVLYNQVSNRFTVGQRFMKGNTVEATNVTNLVNLSVHAQADETDNTVYYYTLIVLDSTLPSSCTYTFIPSGSQPIT